MDGHATASLRACSIAKGFLMITPLVRLGALAVFASALLCADAAFSQATKPASPTPTAAPRRQVRRPPRRAGSTVRSGYREPRSRAAALDQVLQ